MPTLKELQGSLAGMGHAVFMDIYQVQSQLKKVLRPDVESVCCVWW